jgi:hypothetical protein
MLIIISRKGLELFVNIQLSDDRRSFPPDGSPPFVIFFFLRSYPLFLLANFFFSILLSASFNFRREAIQNLRSHNIGPITL